MTFLGIVALLIAIVVDLAVVHSALNSVGFKSGVERIAEERRLFANTFDTSLLLLDPRPAADWLNTHVRHFEVRSQIAPATGNRFLNGLITRLSDQLNTVLPTFEWFVLRTLSLAAAMPVIAICSLVAGFDGWVRREVRKAGAGFESARIYHLAKRSIKPLLLWVCLLYLIVPVTVDVRWAYGILVIAVPLLLGITISRFKKYV